MSSIGFNDFMNTIQSRYNGGFQPYAAGNKRYGAAGRDAPNLGPTTNREGYAQRDREAAARRNIMLQRLKQMQSGSLMRPEYMANQQPGQYRM